MKLQRLDAVNFTVNLTYEKGTKIDLVWRKGELYLSIAGVYLADAKAMYEMPIADIKAIELVDDDNPKLQITIGKVVVTISAKNIHYLQGLRHLLMPFISTNNT